MTLKEIREYLGITQKEFAEKLKLSQGQVSSIERGIRNMTDRLYTQISLVFGLSEEWLKTGTGQPYSEKDLKDSFLNELVKTYDNMTVKEQVAFREFLYAFGILKKDDTSSKVM